jgi:hypothetical protein
MRLMELIDPLSHGLGFPPTPYVRGQPPRPLTIAMARSATCSLVKMLETWLRTVLGLSTSTAGNIGIAASRRDEIQHLILPRGEFVEDGPGRSRAVLGMAMADGVGNRFGRDRYAATSVAAPSVAKVAGTSTRMSGPPRRAESRSTCCRTAPNRPSSSSALGRRSCTNRRTSSTAPTAPP